MEILLASSLSATQEQAEQEEREEQREEVPVSTLNIVRARMKEQATSQPARRIAAPHLNLRES